MALIVKVTSKTKPETIQKALRKIVSGKTSVKEKTIADFYGALPNTFEDGVTYQKKLRDEW